MFNWERSQLGMSTPWSLLVRSLGEYQADFPGKQGEAKKEQTQADPGCGLSGNRSQRELPEQRGDHRQPHGAHTQRADLDRTPSLDDPGEQCLVRFTLLVALDSFGGERGRQ